MSSDSTMHTHGHAPFTLEEKVDELTNQLVHLANIVMSNQPHQLTEKAPEQAPEQETMHEAPTGDKLCLLKFAPPLPFDGTMKDTKSFISSIRLYIKGREPEFHTMESKIMFTLSYMQGGKAQFWRNKAINQIAMGYELFKSFKEFLEKLESQFGDLNPKMTAIGKLKTMRQGSLSADEFILQFKAKALQMDLGDAALIEYLKAGLNTSLFCSIY